MILVNQTFMDQTGFSLLDVPTLAAFIKKIRSSNGRSAGQAAAQIRASLDSDQPSQMGEIAIRTRDGQHRIWDTMAVPIGHLPDGRRLRMAMAADLTERKAVEQRF
jgi:PAS domain S-box-containing protein